MRKRLLAVILTALVASTAVLGGCTTKKDTPADNGKGSEVNTDPFGKYDPPIEVTGGRILASWMKFDDGEDVNNNWWMRTFREELGINVKWKWTAPNWGEPLETKIYTSLATNDMPDFVCVYGSIFKKIVTANKAADLTDAYNKFASPLLKEAMNTEGGIPLKTVTIDGKILGIPEPAILDQSPKLINIRKDWLDNLGLQVPTTFEELEKVAEAFVTKDPDKNGKDDTYGITLDKDLIHGGGILESFGVSTKGWYDKGGKLESGYIQPEIKEAWTKMAEWYKKGIYHKEFAVKDANADVIQDIVSGKVGIVYNSNFQATPAAKNLKKNDPKAEWVSIPMITPDNKTAKTWFMSKMQDFNVVSSSAKHPEAAIKMINLQLQAQSQEKPEFIKNFDYWVTSQGSLSFFMSPFRLGIPFNGRKNLELVREYIKQGKDPSSLPFEATDIYNKLKGYETDKNNVEHWAEYEMSKEGGISDLNQKLRKEKAFYQDPVTWLDNEADAKYGPDMNTRFKEFATRAIMKNDVDKEFDAWVKYFNSNGGQEMTKENNEQYVKVKK
jgi:putative aldouronate transport system substrate-binding protein